MTKKIISEDKSRANLLSQARNIGCEVEVKQILNKYDRLLKQCGNKSEQDQMALMGLIELHKLLNCSMPLVVDDKEILPGNKDELDLSQGIK